MNIFDWLNQISYDKHPWSSFTREDKLSFQPYMIRRFISMKENYIELVSEVQNANIPLNYEYNFWCKSIPKRKTFFRYIKPKKSLPKQELLSILATYYQVSKREILDNFNLLGKDLIKSILLQIGIEERKIKTLLKN